jgi:hypothetical protein
MLDERVDIHSHHEIPAKAGIWLPAEPLRIPDPRFRGDLGVMTKKSLFTLSCTRKRASS